ncbi:hypothetical protein V494_00668 [Pseudogymnoascus sp. VKM F-4513 (FW-928)]|nr:hypothetical protein V494_00668 [Pseudogymnoascus sp. VKM F-4513 (FW-928)]
MSTPKPTLFLVPGAWHPNTCFAPLSALLTTAGYPVHLATLPSLNPTPPAADATCTADALSLRAQLLPIIEEGKDVVVVCHSYGGIPAGGAARGLAKKEREARNEKGGVLGLIYLSSFVVPEGASVVQFLGGEYAPFVQQNQPSPGLCEPSPPSAVFYADVPAPLASTLVASLLPQSLAAFESAAPAPAWAEPAFAGKIAFLKCSADVAVPPFLQDMFMEKSGVEWLVREVETGHSPWASRPEELAEIIGGWVEVFAG